MVAQTYESRRGYFQRAYVIGGISMMNSQEFEVALLKPPDIDGAYFIVPFNVPEVYGT